MESHMDTIYTAYIFKIEQIDVDTYIYIYILYDYEMIVIVYTVDILFSMIETHDNCLQIVAGT